MHTLVLLRHGESTWNLENRFTGWTDVDLSPKGVEEATAAGARGHRAAREAFAAGASELEVHQAFCRAVESTEAQLPYGTIVATDERTRGRSSRWSNCCRIPRARCGTRSGTRSGRSRTPAGRCG